MRSSLALAGVDLVEGRLRLALDRSHELGIAASPRLSFFFGAKGRQPRQIFREF